MKAKKQKKPVRLLIPASLEQPRLEAYYRAIVPIALGMVVFALAMLVVYVIIV